MRCSSFRLRKNPLWETKKSWRWDDLGTGLRSRGPTPVVMGWGGQVRSREEISRPWPGEGSSVLDYKTRVYWLKVQFTKGFTFYDGNYHRLYWSFPQTCMVSYCDLVYLFTTKVKVPRKLGKTNSSFFGGKPPVVSRWWRNDWTINRKTYFTFVLSPSLGNFPYHRPMVVIVLWHNKNDRKKYHWDINILTIS